LEEGWKKLLYSIVTFSSYNRTISDAKLLMGGVKGLKDAWRLGVLHVEYEKLKKIQDQQQQ